MPAIKSIFIANLAEIALPLVRLMKQSRGDQEVFEDHALCDRFIFGGSDDQVLITPFPLDQNFYRDSLELLKLKNVVNLSPKNVEESLCLSILKDRDLINKLADIIRKNPGLKLISYAATPEFYELVDFLDRRGLKFSTPEVPAQENQWVADFFDSKAGFRQVVGNFLQGFPAMPEGVICEGKAEITGWANHFLNKFGSCVLKTNRGLAGAGLKIVHRSDDVGKIVESEAFWQEGPIVVERFVPADLQVCGGAPNVELRIIDGKIEVLYVCSMRVSPEGVFEGVELGKGAVPEKLARVLERTGKEFGKLLKDYGYQGYFETDWVYGLDGKMYPIEANLRRTGGTHVYELAHKLFGPEVFENFYIVANNGSEAKKYKNYQDVKRTTAELFYPIDGKNEGVILTIVNYLAAGKIGYVVIAKNKNRAREIENQFLAKTN